MAPDIVIVTGDLTADGRPAELDDVREALEELAPIPRVVIPGNRDLVPSVGAPGEARPLPLDADLDDFLALEPALDPRPRGLRDGRVGDSGGSRRRARHVDGAMDRRDLGDPGSRSTPAPTSMS